MRFCTLLFLLLSTVNAFADDWPGWMGPQRDNVWREDGILEQFPEGGPKVVWRQEIAGGYAGPAVADGRVFVTDYATEADVKVDNFARKSFTGSERVLCLDEASGEVLWKHEYPVTYGISYPAGPRCTPTVDGDSVYTLGAEGNLICFKADSGEIAWQKNLPAQYETKSALWGYASHPLIDGDKLIVIAGGTGSHAVALNKRTGEEIWRSQESMQRGYSPPSIIEAGGARQLILFHPEGVASVDPENGKTYWTEDYLADNGSVIMTPIYHQGLLYCAGYSNKNLMLELGQSSPTATALWRDEPKTGISPVNIQPYAEDGYLYGFDQGGELIAADFKTGKRLWKANQPLGVTRRIQTGSAFIVRNGDRVWMFNEMGELLIAKLSPAGYEEIDRAKVIQPTGSAFGRKVVWSAPAWANKRVYLRNDEECVCIDLAR
ncbi:MAG: PQQ-binding-like beta-propeller repeat protein [Planctomycetota bacterium]